MSGNEFWILKRESNVIFDAEVDFEIIFHDRYQIVTLAKFRETQICVELKIDVIYHASRDRYFF